MRENPAMRVYLTQHGRATTEEQDPDRPLTPEGEADVRRVIDVATSLGDMTVDRVVHSGKTRARQTAELWAAALGAAATEADGLAPMDDPAIWAERLAGGPGDVLLAGHLPHLSRLASLLLAGDADRAMVGFRPGGLVRLEPGDEGDEGDEGWTVGLVLPPTG
jgi:phosphohistidine phosphatase